MNKSFRISPNKGLSRDWLIRLVKNKKGGGEGGLKERGIINFLPLNGGGGGILDRGLYGSKLMYKW